MLQMPKLNLHEDLLDLSYFVAHRSDAMVLLMGFALLPLLCGSIDGSLSSWSAASTVVDTHAPVLRWNTTLLLAHNKVWIFSRQRTTQQYLMDECGINTDALLAVLSFN